MKNKKNIVDVFNEILADQTNKEDIIINPNDIKVDQFSGKLELGGRGFYNLDEWSLRQMSKKVMNNLSVKYYRECPAFLQAQNLNYWLQQYDPEKNLMFRVRNDINSIRGIMSEQFTSYDDHELLEVLNTLLKDRDHEVNMWSRHDGGFHLRVILNDIRSDVGTLKDGRPDIHRIGVHIENSEVGQKSLHIKPMVYRQVCSNGLMMWVTDGDSMNQHHRGKDRVEMQELVEKYLVAAVHAGEEVLETLKRAKEINVEDPIQLIEKFGKEKKYSEKFVNQVKTSFESEKGNNVFYLVQAFTHAVQTLKNDDTRVEIEQDAGRLLHQLVRAA